MNINYPLTACCHCFKKLDLQKINSKKDILLSEENRRKIYFAPVGNQFNFGKFANGNTPKVIIMGITTSPSAMLNFLEDFKRFRKKLRIKKALKHACILNIFNSDSPILQCVLSKILNLSKIPKIVGWSDDLKIDRNFFEHYLNNPDIDNLYNLMNGIYFTQLIFCSSCDENDSYKAPKFEDLGDFQEQCINAQIEILESFNDKVKLLITFGDVQKFLNKLGKSEILKNICKRHINISHPVSRGWNLISMMDLHKENFYKIVRNKYKSKKNIITQTMNCYDQLSELKKCGNQDVMVSK